MWHRITWEQFARATKLMVAIGWATMELWQWGARPAALLFVASVLGVTEGSQLYARLKDPAP